MKLFCNPKEIVPFEVRFGQVVGAVDLLARMSAGVLAGVEAQTSRFQMSIDQATSGEGAGAQQIGAEYSQTHAENVLLVANIKGWHGDLFGGKPANRDNILSMNPDHPVRRQILEEIDRRNQPYQSEQTDEAGDFLPETDT